MISLCLYRFIHVSPATELREETREELRMADEEENANKQVEKFIKDAINEKENDNENGNVFLEPIDCPEDIELITCL